MKIDITGDILTIIRIVTGKVNFNLEMLCAVCDELDCELGALLTGCSTKRSSYLSDELYEKCRTMTERQKQKALQIIDILLERE